MQTPYQHILQAIPHQPPFRFVDAITHLDTNGIEGNYYLSPTLDFYKGHFPNNPITPGVILTEIMAQIGLVAFGIYLLMEQGHTLHSNMLTLLTETNIKYKQAVLPNQTVYVQAQKIIFRHGKLQCKVQLTTTNGTIMCGGTLSGMVIVQP